MGRGLKGISKEKLIEFLSSVGYYRLRGYTYPYQDNAQSDTLFVRGSDWFDIESDYNFDICLRTLVVEALGYIEIAARSQLEYQLSISHGSRWYEDPSLCHDKNIFQDNLKELKKHWDRSREVFKEHYEQDYDATVSPPAWMIFETTTFGTVSKIFANLDNSVNAKTEISKYFGFNKASTKVLVSWFQHLNLVRNICAHYSRLFSRSFIVKPKVPTNCFKKWVGGIQHQDRIYMSICVITKLLEACAPDYEFKNALNDLMSKASPRQLTSMGFPNDWKTQDLFK